VQSVLIKKVTKKLKGTNYRERMPGDINKGTMTVSYRHEWYLLGELMLAPHALHEVVIDVAGGAAEVLDDGSSRALA
jgi:hypothetical protein